MEPTILLIEDDDIDRRAIKRYLIGDAVHNRVVDAKDGREALEILRSGKDSLVSKPYLIILDINMPIMDGHEFLDEIRADVNLKDSLVFVLTTSASDKDIRLAYSNNVAGYLLKENIGDKDNPTTRLIGDYIKSVKFPGDYR